MYTLLIVDDEALVRQSIATIIDWGSLGFTRIYQAEDGIEALEICKNCKVDLILTDIVMPFMDGLELSRIVTRDYPKTHIVVLTGHEDFEYAKESVDLGVKNYILKPVGASTLYTKMKEICKKLRIEETQKKYIAKMREQVLQSMPALREKFLYSLVCTPYGKGKNIEEGIRNLELPLKGDNYVVGIIEADLTQVSYGDRELFEFTMKNVTQDSVGNQHCIFGDYNHHIIVVFNVDDIQDDARDIIYRTLQVIQKAVYSILKVDITCAIGTIVSDIKDIYQSYKEADIALDCKYSLGSNRVYDISDLNYIEKSFFYPFDEIKTLIYSIKFLQTKDIEESLQGIFDILIHSKNLSSSNIKMIFIEVITCLLKELSSIKELPLEVWNEGIRLYNSLEHVSSLEKLQEGILVFSLKIAKELHRLQSHSGQILIETVKDFIEENYTDTQLCLATVAGHVGVSTGYLSALFKKETSINFTDYLTDVRMKKAMQLLKTTDKRTYEIAYEIGFSNPHYFSISFKKYSGMSPSDFRLIR
ncbi:hypothetical protein CS063_14680 [Sporanaerobium hydrogeniformans]|uniref:Uncharacterized protein n=1 Tax=Sporanaerobium hydrogeniformans TaxID=3072179 RepID=A0AC61D9W7_9FIRM|nr:response regulator [Sporanaerobium hydrogeniformans]PHV69665.1 hypothetical protein CS063_14680 [Sporanaerobium hydrogeniformans]